jgi:Icc protein
LNSKVNKQEKVIELVQLSDPHLFADKSAGLYEVNSFDSFAKVVAEAGKQRIDLAVVTGDLVHDESETGYGHLRECLETLNVPVHLIPGNHDDLAYIQAEFSQGPISCAKQILTGGWQILLLNTQLPGKVGGHLDEGELHWLEQCLSANSAAHTLIFLHHNPVPSGCKWLDPIGLDNPDRFFELIAAFPQIKAVSWGHIHQVFEEQRAGVRLLSAPSTCIQFKPDVVDFELDFLPPGYRWFRLFEDGNIETGVRRLAAVPEGFDPTAEGYN